MIVKVAVAALASDAIGQVTVPPLPTLGFVQLNAGPVGCASETNVVLAGSVSVNETVVACDGPLFVTVMLYVTFDPATAAGVAVLVRETSAGKKAFVFGVGVL